MTNEGFEVKCFSTPNEFWETLQSNVPSLIILDIMLPEQSGMDILKKLKKTEKYLDIPVIMVTAKTAEIDIIKGLDVGADDYICKPFKVMEMISRVKAVLRRASKDKNKTNSNKLHFKEIEIDSGERKVYVDGVLCDLTFKEFELLKYLMANKNIALSRDDILNNIWGYEFAGGTRTVDAHINTLRKKLGEPSKYIKTVINIGYKIDG